MYRMQHSLRLSWCRADMLGWWLQVRMYSRIMPLKILLSLRFLCDFNKIEKSCVMRNERFLDWSTAQTKPFHLRPGFWIWLSRPRVHFDLCCAHATFILVSCHSTFHISILILFFTSITTGIIWLALEHVKFCHPKFCIFSLRGFEHVFAIIKRNSKQRARTIN